LIHHYLENLRTIKDIDSPLPREPLNNQDIDPSLPREPLMRNHQQEIPYGIAEKWYVLTTLINIF